MSFAETVSPPLLHIDQPIAGYAIRQRIGAGGYGEVWKAEAPGGLPKAVKFVYGYIDGERAACELKALHRIKEVRHPFLLSLERIEVIDGQLMIVTELADESLKDRYEACRRDGRTGIGRDELLVYLGDAADALDYMSQRHSLQHLDVKPENLLIVGGRVKVADFGLVKDLRHHSHSLLGGLTPAYAPPELFEDEISVHSDQYSLAIVYQEMLTGSLPFPGKTASQLAAQHKHGRPQLGALGDPDRAAVARALAKQPENRFPSCRALVDALLGRETAAAAAERLPAPSPEPASSDTSPGATLVTECAALARKKPSDASDGLPSGSSSRPSTPYCPPPFIAEKPQALPPPATPAAAPQFHPTLVLGIGGMAGRVLRQLRFRLCQRFGDPHVLPGLQMLLVDTDRSDLLDAIHGDETAALESSDTMLMALRKPEDYRQQSADLLKWLSRRWLYNIPHSLQPDGLRPLGRLALVDHARPFAERVRAALEHVLSDPARAESAAATGWTVNHAVPRVFIVASIDGGTGSGMVADAGYLVRRTLAELGASDGRIFGLLLHAEAQGYTLAAANAQACLREMAYYERRGYPGDPACGLPPFGPGSPFHHAYIVLPKAEAEDPRAASAEMVAEYLYLNTVTPHKRFFDACREATDGETPGMGTFGLFQLGCRASRLAAGATGDLAAEALRQWCARPARSTPTVSTADRETVGPATAAPAHARGAIVVDCVHRFRLDEPLLLADMEAAVARSKADAAGGAVPEAAFVPAMPTAASLAENIGRTCVAAVWSHLASLVDAGDLGVQTMHDVLQQLDEHLKSLARGIPELAKQVDVEIARASAATPARDRGRPRFLNLLRLGPSAAPPPPGAALERLQVRREALEATGRFLQVVRAELAARQVQLGEFVAELEVVANRLKHVDGEPAIPSGATAGELQETFERVAERLLESRRNELIEAIGQDVFGHEPQRLGVLCDLVGMRRELSRLLPTALRHVARRRLQDAIRRAGGLAQVFPLGTPDQAREFLGKSLPDSTPGLTCCGGASRLLVLMPDSAGQQVMAAAVATATGVPPTAEVSAEGDVLLCQEIQQIGSEKVIAWLADSHPESIDVATRLHSRIDISWQQ